MRIAAALAVAGLFLLPGCLLEVGERHEEPYAWSVRREPSMLPHFPGSDDETYPIVIVHSHVAESEREQDEYRTGKRTRVVCFTLDDLAPAPAMMSSSRASADAAAMCIPSHDPGTGRLFVDEEEFAAWDPYAIAILGSYCGTPHPLDKSSPGLNVEAPRHRFRVEFLRNETLRVDDSYVEPGHALKIDYRDPGDDASARDDDRAVTIVFDYPGRWLRSRVGPMQEGEWFQERPPEGDGPEAWLPRHPAHLGNLIGPLVAASPANPTEITALRVTLVDGNVTDLVVELGASQPTRWFVAGGTDEKVRMLGATADSPADSRVPIEKFLSAFNATPLAGYGSAGRGVTLDVRWAPEQGLRSPMPIAWSETWLPASRDCDLCRFVWAADPAGTYAWRATDRSEPTKGEDQLTLIVKVVDGKGEHERLFFRP